MAQDVNIKIKVDTSQANNSTENYKKRLKELKDEMTALQVETDGLSKASEEQRQRFTQLSNEAGKIQDAMSDTAQQVKNLSDDYAGMTAALEGIGAAVGGITAVSGAMSLFGIENEKAAETIKKLTSLMSILQGIQTVEKALNKDSALMTMLRAKAQSTLNNELAKTTTAETAGTAATATFTAAEGAATTGAGALTVGIKAVGTAIKSIPVVGWILAAVGALTTLITLIYEANQAEADGNAAREKHLQQLRDMINLQARLNSATSLMIIDLSEYSKILSDISKKGSKEWENAVAMVAKQTGLSTKYIESHSSSISNIIDNYSELTAETERYNSYLQQQQALLNERTEKEKKGEELTQDYFDNIKAVSDKILESKTKITNLQIQYNGYLAADKKYNDNIAAAEKNRVKQVAEVKEAYEDWDAVMDELSQSIPNLTEKEKKHQEQIEFWKPLISSTEELVGDSLKKIDEEEEEYFKREEERLNRLQQIREAKWKAASLLVSTYSELVNTSMEAELEAAEGNEEEQKRIRKKYARSKFLAQIGSIGVSTAQAIMEAWSSVASIMFPGNVIAGGVLTAMLAATGIAQTMKARAEMDNALKAARGGILNGPSHAQGGIVLSNGVEAEGGEAIINKKSTAAFAPLLSEINSFNGYGAPLISSASASGGSMGAASDEAIRRIVAATVEGVTSIPVVVSEHAVTEAQRTVRLTKERSLI